MYPRSHSTLGSAGRKLCRQQLNLHWVYLCTHTQAHTHTYVRILSAVAHSRTLEIALLRSLSLNNFQLSQRPLKRTINFEARSRRDLIDKWAIIKVIAKITYAFGWAVGTYLQRERERKKGREREASIKVSKELVTVLRFDWYWSAISKICVLVCIIRCRFDCSSASILLGYRVWRRGVHKRLAMASLRDAASPWPWHQKEFATDMLQ